MHENFSQDLSLASIAAAAEVPIRTLLDAFSRFREENPMRKLRDMRLDHAHTLLRTARCSTITDAALSIATLRLGRFPRTKGESSERAPPRQSLE